MRFRSFISIILLLLSVSAGRASATGTAVTGMVVDTSGGSLPGVTVTMTLKGADKGTKTEAAEPLLQVTDGDGRFTFDGVGPGIYTVVFSLPGFDDKTLESIAVPAEAEL